MGRRLRHEQRENLPRRTSHDDHQRSQSWSPSDRGDSRAEEFAHIQGRIRAASARCRRGAARNLGEITRGMETEGRSREGVALPLEGRQASDKMRSEELTFRYL